MQKKTRRFERTAASVCKEYAILTLATLVMSAGTYLFKFPNNFSFGGVTGLAVVLSAVSPLSAGTYNFIINMVLLVLGFLFLGKGFGVKTVYISVLMSVALSAAEKLFPMSGPLTDQPVLELIFAIAIPGISSAIMFNMGASSGGTDIVAMILKKYTSMNIGTALLAVDLLIAVSACFVFDITTGLFSLCGLFTKTIVIDTAIENINLCKYFTIVCKDPTPICDFIHTELGRSATLFTAEGTYSGQEEYIVLTVMKRSQAVQLRNYIKKVQPQAFMMITNSSEIIGKGFRNTI